MAAIVGSSLVEVPDPRPRTPARALSYIHDIPPTPRSYTDTIVSFTPRTPGTEYLFNPISTSRTNSIYTLSRASFAGQLSQLTSLVLPDANTLAATVRAIPTATASVRALGNASGQIKRWIQKAVEVLGSLDAEDDVEWAAAGQESLVDVENAITQFATLVSVYVLSIDEVRRRVDVKDVPRDEFRNVMDNIEDVLNPWANVKRSLAKVKKQVELAKEWEDLWNTVLGNVAMEIEELTGLVFEMEEKRHRTLAEDSRTENLVQGFDRLDLDKTQSTPTNLDFPIVLPVLHSSSLQEDPALMQLFARLQPLRTSLSFLPMRLSDFALKASSILPSACAELETRRQILEERWTNLEASANNLRRELGDDRWVDIFRGAGRQAERMCESIERAIANLAEAIDQGLAMSNPPLFAKRVGEYEVRKTNYGPAIRKVMDVIDQGIKEKATVSGEVLKIQADAASRWLRLEEKTARADKLLASISSTRPTVQESVSSTWTNELSPVESAGLVEDTPASSPPTSDILPQVKQPALRTPSQTLPATPESMKLRQAVLQRSSPAASGNTSSTPITSRSNTPRVSSVSSIRTATSTPRSSLSASSASSTPRTSSAGKAPGTNKPQWKGTTRVSETTFTGWAKPTKRIKDPLAKPAIPVRAQQPSKGTPGTLLPAPTASKPWIIGPNRAASPSVRAVSDSMAANAQARTQNSLSPLSMHTSPSPLSRQRSIDSLGRISRALTPSLTSKQASPSPARPSLGVMTSADSTENKEHGSARKYLGLYQLEDHPADPRQPPELLDVNEHFEHGVEQSPSRGKRRMSMLPVPIGRSPPQLERR